MSQLAEKVSDLVKIPDVLSKYGYPTNDRKRIPCPLHNGKKPNFCYTDEVFHCWSCGESGNVISLTMKLFGVTFPEALMKINNDFSLGLSSRKPTYRERIQQAENKEVLIAKDRLKNENRAYYNGVATFHSLVFKEICNGNNDPDLVGLEMELEKWLEDNIEEVVQPWH